MDMDATTTRHTQPRVKNAFVTHPKRLSCDSEQKGSKNKQLSKFESQNLTSPPPWVSFSNKIWIPRSYWPTLNGVSEEYLSLGDFACNAFNFEVPSFPHHVFKDLIAVLVREKISSTGTG